MNVSIGSELERFIQEKIDSGLYQSASEVVREALRLLHERDQLKQTRLDTLRNLAVVGVDDADHGRVQQFDEAAVERIKTKGRRKLSSRR
jgi:antitoxin ParD1/3/4